MVRGRPEPDATLVARVGELALRLPEVHEQDAWTGVRWRIRQRTVAHVVALPDEVAAARSGVADGRAVTLVSLRCVGEERAALVAMGPPYLPSGWSDQVVNVLLDDDTDWTEIEELVTESYRLLAPARLVRQLDAPGS